MKFAIVFTESARRDISESNQWFLDKSGAALAERFVDSLENCVTRIADKPESFAVVYKDYRHGMLSAFPYLVTFRIKGKAIEILAVTHGSRNPDIWKRRT